MTPPNYYANASEAIMYGLLSALFAFCQLSSLEPPSCFPAVLPAGWLPLNDPLTRALLFVPLFTLLIVRLHRNTLAGSPGLTGVLSQPLLTYLVG